MQKTHEEVIKEILTIDYEILNLSLENALRKQLEHSDLFVTDKLIEIMMPVMWASYTMQN